MADDPSKPEEPPTPPTAASDKPASHVPGEPLKAEVSRTDAPSAGASAAPPAAAPAAKPAAPAVAKPAAPAAATGALRRRLLPVFNAAASSRSAEGAPPREPADCLVNRRLAVVELARTRSPRHVRDRVRRTSGSAPHPDAGRLARVSAAEGL